MSVTTQGSLQHPPDVVFRFVRDFISSLPYAQDMERRDQSRRLVTMSVETQPLDSDFQPAGPVFVATTKDISTGGIGILHNEEVTVPYLQICLVTPAESMKLLTQVKHCTPVNSCYHIGCRFVVDWSSWLDAKRDDSISSTQNSDLMSPSNKAMRR